MVIWSILTQQAWHDLQRQGRLRATRRHVIQEFLGPYAWMVRQMEQRLTARGQERMPCRSGRGISGKEST